MVLITSIMVKKLQFELINYINRKSKNIDSAFTLVELIVVIVIIGILSSIAVPAFRNAADKARQKEASTLVSTYVKAAQAYQTETGSAARTAANLKEYISVTKCTSATSDACSTETPIPALDTDVTWVVPSGSFRIIMNYNDTSKRTIFTATSTADPQGKGVSGCYNNTTGSSKLIEQNTAGAVAIPEC